MAVKPADVGDAMQRALKYHQEGQFEPAARLYRDVLRRQPANPDALHLLGLIELASQAYSRAEQLIQRAVQAHPGVANYHNSLGRALQGQGKLAEAEVSYRRALALAPDLAEAYANLASVHVAKGQLQDASACYGHAVDFRPTYVDALSDWGAVLRRLGRLNDAEQALRRSLAIKADHLAALVNLGAVLQEQGRHDEAIGSLSEALRLDARNPQALNNIGLALHASGHFAHALASFDAAVALQPDFGNGHWNRSLTLLLTGDFERGWDDYEWRWRSSDFPTPLRQFTQPAWTGEPLHGRTILVHAEQGLGDTIQFARYLGLVADRGGRIVLECPPELATLLADVEGVEQLVSYGQALPDFDVHSPLLSLPYVFKTRLDSIPPADLRLRKGRVPPRLRMAPRPRVGLVWAGSPRNKIDRRRSMALQDLAPLSRLTGATLVSLQKGAAAAQLAAPPQGLDVLDVAPELSDFADTAAAVAELDVVVSVDTAVAHLAGALRAPVCLLLPAVPDWRWQLVGERTPWYSTMTLFRQSLAGDWDGVLGRLVAHLDHLAR
jgi:tetratricopeptide (TPR) repeat protein